MKEDQKRYFIKPDIFSFLKKKETVPEPEDELMHYGTPRHSGRYPWGSGDNPYQHSSEFMSQVNDFRKQGYSDTEIAKLMNMSTGEFRARVTISKEQITNENRIQAKKLKDEGYTNEKIGEMLGVSEGTVRNLLKEQTPSKRTSTQEMALYLKDQVDAKGMIDVGAGVEKELGISDVALTSAITKLQDEEGYELHTIKVEQMTNPGKYTTIKVLATPGTTKGDVYRRSSDIQTVTPYDEFAKIAEEKHPGFARTKYGMYVPQSISSDRIQIRYAEEGGKDKDGVIEIRRGAEDLSLGKSNYAQVRIAVDGTHYLKGMAMYSDDLPDGVDVIFNTNKSTGTPMKKVLKELKDDPDNPFGAAIKPEEKGGQRFYFDDDGNEHLSSINIVNAEGDWGEWSKTLSSQFLSKQNLPLVKKQLEQSYVNKLDEYNDIMLLENPVIKQKMLYSFADDCDASAVHLKAVSLPRQASHVILPITDMDPTEVYAPKYENGESVVLIRYPHGGTFEIPKLKVNNNQETARNLLGNATDAIGINAKVAEQLSGADFDGDTVMVIPVSNGGIGTKVNVSAPLEALKEFDTNDYAVPESSPLYLVDAEHGFHKQTEMGKVSNLITDMTLLGATPDEIARAVKHSMVVIDAEKHHLDWRQSAVDNGIPELKTKYQGGPNKGASTLISKASSDFRINERKVQYTDKNDPNVKNGINIVTGEKVYRDTGATYHKSIKDENGKVIGYKEEATLKKTKTTKMAATNDAFTLVSEAATPVEQAYATYANQLKALANTARKEMMATVPTPYSKSAKETYRKEVDALEFKLNEALKNAPRERQAQLSANAIYKIKLQDNPGMSDDDKKKIKSQALAEQRVRYGAKRTQIEITDAEWEAIQAGAISTQRLKDIMDHTDMDKLKERAMPKNNKTEISSFKMNRIQMMSNNGYSIEDIANAVGLSAATVSKYLSPNRKEG